MSLYDDEGRFIRERLAELQRAYQKEIESYLKRLAHLAKMQPLPPMYLPPEQSLQAALKLLKETN